MSRKQFYVYILASRRNGTLYTQRDQIHKLVHYEIADDVNAAITREKQLKKWKRAWKVRLIEERTLGGKTSTRWWVRYLPAAFPCR